MHTTFICICMYGNMKRERHRERERERRTQILFRRMCIRAKKTQIPFRYLHDEPKPKSYHIDAYTKKRNTYFSAMAPVYHGDESMITTYLSIHVYLHVKIIMRMQRKPKRQDITAWKQFSE
jgi:hypothetical protein